MRKRTCFFLPMVAKRFKEPMKTMETLVKKKKSKGGRPIKSVKRDSGIRVRLSKTEHYIIAETAKKAGMKISDWFRQSAKRASVTGRFTPEDMKLLRVLSGLANNLNQIAKKANEQGLLIIQRNCRNLISEIDDLLKLFNKDDR